MENGLPQNTVSVLLQSRSGFLWAGTELGLARFDGSGFRVFDHATVPQFPDTEVRSLLDAQESAAGSSGNTGGLWVGTAEGLVHWSHGQPTLLSVRDGLPSNSIQGLAQTKDGVVWAWTEEGLARSHGGRFEAVPTPNFIATTITSLATDSDGGLWVGTLRGVAVFRNGGWQTGKSSGAFTGAALVASVSGDVLVSAAEGIYTIHSGTATLVLPKTDLPRNEVSFLDRLSGGALVAASKSEVVVATPGQSNARATRFSVAKELPGSRIESLHADREGCLWIGTNRGLARISAKDGSLTVQVMPPSHPLAQNAVIAILEDREGDLWIGTEGSGLHILRDARFQLVGTREGLSSDATTAVVEGGNHFMWIGTRDAGLNRFVIDDDVGPNAAEHSSVKTSTNLSTATGLRSNVILALASDPNGDLWVGTPDGLNRVRAGGGSTKSGKIESFTSADGLPDDFIRSLLVTPDHTLWIGTRRGLTHLEQGKFKTFTAADGLGSDLVGALVSTPDGDLWIATLTGLSRLHQGRLRNYTTSDGLSSNVITALDVTPDGSLWVGTQSDGLNLWDGKHFYPIRGDSKSVLQEKTKSNQQQDDKATEVELSFPQAIHAVTHDDYGHLWITSEADLSRADLRGLMNCAERQTCSERTTALTNFSTADGLRTRETSSNSHPTTCRTHNGQLWFTTPRGVIVLDPVHFASNPIPTPIAIERFAVDDQDQDESKDGLTRVAAGHLRFQFDYAGLGFAAPQKLAYQYTLEGFDSSWTNAGSRRTAYYTNIPPGTYRFRVRTAWGEAAPMGTNVGGAAYEDSPEADLRFELRPHYYQTPWFFALAILLLVLLVLFIFKRRVLRVEREFRAVMAERNRIAREIHDTLAQGYVGISLQLEILGELLRHNRTDAAAKQLKGAQEMVREGLDDARQSIWALRSQDAHEDTLPIRLRRQVEKARDQRLAAHLEIHGAYRALPADSEKEVLRIAQEAIQNVKKHSAATELKVRLDYDVRTMILTVADNGKGFASGGAGTGKNNNGTSNAGHFGITGMRERCALIHGELDIDSRSGQGTSVLLKVPAPEATESAKASAKGSFQGSQNEATDDDQSKEQL